MKKQFEYDFSDKQLKMVVSVAMAIADVFRKNVPSHANCIFLKNIGYSRGNTNGGGPKS